MNSKAFSGGKSPAIQTELRDGDVEKEISLLRHKRMGQESKKLIPMPQPDLDVNVINPHAAQMDEPRLETDSLVSYRMRIKRPPTEIRMK